MSITKLSNYSNLTLFLEQLQINIIFTIFRYFSALNGQIILIPVITPIKT